MSVKIRLRRMGNTNNPFYRIVVADARSPSKGRFLETLGWYDPKEAEAKKNFKVDVSRVNYWVGNGAELSDTVNSLVKKAIRMVPPVVAGAVAEIEEPVAVAQEVVAETAVESSEQA